MEFTHNPIENTMNITQMTQDVLAEKLGITRQTLVNYKNNPDTIPAGKLIALSKFTGLSLEHLCGSLEKTMGPRVKHTYSKLYSKMQHAVSIAESQLGILHMYNIDVDEQLYMPVLEEIKETLENCLAIAKEQGRKPLLCAFGQSDTGKSTFINFLLQDDVAPTSYSPMTTVPTYYCHISEKPECLLDEHENTIVFGRKKGSKLEKFEHDFYMDVEKAKEYKLQAGEYQSILTAFGTREGTYYDSDSIEISEIVVFLDNDILQEITFVDIPGFGSGDKRDDVGLTMDMARFDVVFFLSLSNGFFRAEEMTALKQILSSRSNMDSVYILATHANAVGNPEQVNQIMQSGCNRLANMMTDVEVEELGMKRNNCISRIFKRCYAFDAFNEHYSEAFNKDFENLIPRIIEKRVKGSLKSLRNASREYKKLYEQRLKDLDKKEKMVLASCSNSFKEEAKKKIIEIKNKMYKVLDREIITSKDRFYGDYEAVMNEDFIVDAIKRKDIKNKKVDIEAFSSYLSSEINDRLKANLKDGSERFINELNSNIDSYKEVWTTAFNENKINIDMSFFNFTKAFARGLSGVAVYGALALWATIVAGGSNLGAYNLIAKIVSALGAIGISLGGTATVTAFVASIGGPVVLGLAIALIAAVSVFGILTGNWRERLAKKLIKAYDEKGFKRQCVDSVEEYWDNTKAALDACLDTLNSETIDYYNNQMEISSLSDDKFKKINNACKVLYNQAIMIFSALAKDNDDVLQIK